MRSVIVEDCMRPSFRATLSTGSPHTIMPQPGNHPTLCSPKSDEQASRLTGQPARRNICSSPFGGSVLVRARPCESVFPPKMGRHHRTDRESIMARLDQSTWSSGERRTDGVPPFSGRASQPVTRNTAAARRRTLNSDASPVTPRLRPCATPSGLPDFSQEGPNR